MMPKPAGSIPLHKVMLVRLEWREERLDVLSPKEIDFHPRDTQARGRTEKSDANHHDTIGIHLQKCEMFLSDQARHNDGRKSGR